MTVKELKEKLEQFDENLNVCSQIDYYICDISGVYLRKPEEVEADKNGYELEKDTLFIQFYYDN